MKHQNTSEHVRTVQDKQSGSEVDQSGSGKIRHVGKSHPDYWAPRLVKRSYAWEGKTVEIPEWQARISHLGRREFFNLGTPNKAAAAAKARDIYLSLIASGWDVTLARFKPQAAVVVRLDLTVGSFMTAVKDTGLLRLRTFLCYQNCLRLIVGESFGVKADRSRFDYKRGGNKEWTDQIDRIRLEQVTPAVVASWQQGRLKAAGNSPVAIATAKRSINSYTRCARSLFGKEIIKRLVGVKLPAELPFSDVSLFDSGSVKYASKLNVKGTIAAARAELKDADPEAFKAFLLGLFAGLRKGEIDMLEWRMVDWENHVIRLEQTEWLHLKTKDSAGEVSVDPEVITELRDYLAKSHSPFVITSDREPRNDSARQWYRCKPVFDRLNEWLRAKGIVAGKPLHELRKEIGSLIATQHGIYAASRFPRHSDIGVTAKHYAEHKARISVGLGQQLLDTEIKPAVGSE